MTSTELETLVRALISDPDASFCSASVLTLHTEETCRDFSRRTGSVRKSASVSFTATAEVTLPTDCHEIIQLYDANGIDLDPLGDSQLNGLDLTATGTPTNRIRSLNGPDKIRLWPVPATTGTLTCFYVHEQPVTGTTPYTISIDSRYHGGLAYGAAAKILLLSGNETDAAKLQAYQSFYESTVADAIRDVSKNFSSHGRSIPYRHF